MKKICAVFLAFLMILSCIPCAAAETPVAAAQMSGAGCDLNLDGKTDEKDLTILTRHVAKIEPLTTESALKTADFNSDGRINAADITALAGYITSPAQSKRVLKPGDKGIDVSAYQPNINWQSVKASGISFAIIRAGWRGYGSGVAYDDSCYTANISGAIAAGIKVGVYFFSQAITEAEAIEEANMCIKSVSKYHLDLPIFIDTEYTGDDGRADKLTTAKRTAICNAFCRTVENAGYRSGLYASYNWLVNNLNRYDLEADWIWLAHWNNTTDYADRYDVWQYGAGQIGGISGNVDVDIIPDSSHWSND